MKLNGWIIGCWLCLAFVGTRLPVWAQPAPDETLYLQANAIFDQRQYATAIPRYVQFFQKFPQSKFGDQAALRLARCYVEVKQLPEAVQTLDWLRQQYPQSPVAPDGTVLLFRTLLAQPDLTRAKAVWDEVFARWPKTEYAWQVAEANYQVKAQTDPEQALTWFDDLAKHGVLPETAATRVAQVRFKYLETAKPAQFLTEALPVIATAKDAKAAADLTLPTDLARRVYLPLMTAGRYDEANTLSQQLQEALKRLGNPANGLQTDQTAYYAALERTNPARFLADALPLATQVAQAATKGDVAWPADLARRVYPLLCQADRLDEAAALHGQVQGKLQALGLPDVGVTDRNAYLTARLGFLEKMRPAQFLTEATAVIANAPMTTTATVQVPADVAKRLYLPLMSTGRVQEAMTLHDRLYGTLLKLGNPNNGAVADLTAYLAALERTQPAQFVTEAMAVITGAADATSIPAVQLPVDLARRCYPLLLTLGRGPEAEVCHQQLQRTLQALGAVDLANADTTAYQTARLGALEKANPGQFLADALQVVTGLEAAQSPTEAALPVAMVAKLYAPLIAAGRLDEAQRLHGRVEVTLTRLGNPNDGVKADRTAYYGALQRGNPAQFLVEAIAVLKATETATTPNDVLFALSLAPQTYAALAQANRMDDLNALRKTVQTACGKLKLSMDSVQAEQNAYQTALERGKPDLFITEAQTCLAALTTAKTADEAKLPVDLARRAYPLLCTAGRLTEAHTLNTQVQAALTKLAAPDLAQADEIAYRAARLNALERGNPTQFVQEAMPVIQGSKTATTLPALTAPMDLAKRVYPLLMAAERWDEAKALHDQLLASLAKVGTPNDAQTETNTYLTARLAALEKSHLAQFLTEGVAVVQAAAKANTLTEAQVPLATAPRLYGPLLTARRMEETKAIHGQMQALIRQLGNPNNSAQTELAAYLATLEKADSAAFIAEALPLITSITEASTPEACKMPADLARRVYAPLAALGRLEEAQAVHEQVGTALTRVKQADFAVTDTNAYLTARLGALEKTDSARFLTEATAVLTGVAKARTAAELAVPVALAPRVYAPLVGAGKLDTANTLHTQLQAALGAQGNPNGWGQTDRLAYLGVLEKSAPVTFVTETLAQLQALSATTPTAEAGCSVGLLPRVYTALVQQKRLDDLTTLHARLQQVLPKLASPPDAAQTEQTAYLAVLERAVPERFIADAQPTLAALTAAKTADDGRRLLDLATRLYPLLCGVKRLDEAKTLHEQVGTVATRVGLADQLPAETTAYLTARLAVLEKSAPDQFLAEGLPVAQQAATVKTAADLAFPVDVTRRLYLPLCTAGRGGDAQTLHTQVQAAWTRLGGTTAQTQADTTAYLAAVERTTLALFLDEAVKLIAAGKATNTLDGAKYLVDLAKRLYAPLYAASRWDDVKAVHDQVQALAGKVNQPDMAQADTTAYLTARLAYLEKARPAQFLAEALPLITGVTTAKTAADLTLPADLARRVYAPLMAAGRVEEAKTAHAQLQTMAGKLDAPSVAQADQAAYLTVWLGVLERTNAAQFLTEALPVVDQVKTATGPADLTLPVNLAGRVYAPLIAAGRWEDASARHTQAQAALAQWGNPGNLAVTELTAYLNALTDGVTKLLQTPTTPSEVRTKARTLFLATWTSDPAAMIDRVVPLVRDRLMRDATAAEWLAPYAALVEQLPKEHPTRPAALALLGQFAQSQALNLQVRGGDATERLTQMERAYRTLVTEYPGAPATPQAWSALLTLYQTTNRVAEVEGLLKGVTDTKTLLDPLLWLATYYFNTGMATDVPKAAEAYGRLLQLATQHEQAAVWQYRLAVCLEKQGKTTDALAAYQKVVDGYPTSSAVVTAAQKIAALKGGK